MLRSTLLVVVALVFVSTAFADGGPSPGAVQGDPGVVSSTGLVRYVTLPAGAGTLLTAIRTQGGRLDRWTELSGNWAIPAVAYDGTTGGLSHDGSTLVLTEPGFGACAPTGCTPLRTTSWFQVYQPKSFRLRAQVKLRGDFAYDALSPHGRVLYLIQHVSKTNLTSYLVRAYDLRKHVLRAGAIADRTQRGWVMQGTPMARATSADGRFVYTLYQNPGGYPFIHALDTVRGIAHCTGLPWPGDVDQGVLGALVLSADGRTLAVDDTSGYRFFALDTHTYRVTPVRPHHNPGFRWWLPLAAGAGLLVGTLLALRARRLRGRFGRWNAARSGSASLSS
jgi:hypothetical protein